MRSGDYCPLIWKVVMSIIVTGGCGFIGTNFVKGWLSLNDEKLVNIDKLTYAAYLPTSEINHENYQFIHSDVNNRQTLSDVFNEIKPRALVHFAAETHVDRSIANADNFVSTNINGTHSVLEESLRYWSGYAISNAPEFRLINISTDEVYGSLAIGEDSFSEDSPICPNSPYSASKASADLLVRSYVKTYGLPAVTTRCSNNFGPFQNHEKFIPVVINSILNEREIPIYGDGKQIRDWLFVEDHVSAIMHLVDVAKPGSLFNIGGGIELENIVVAKFICKRLGDKLGVKHNQLDSLLTQVKDRPAHDFRYSINCNKIFKEHAWHASHSFEESMEKTIDWYISEYRNSR